VKIPWRVGQGIDRHALVEGRPLWLGGVQIPFPLGLAGHSDGDAVVHAVCDALLGAAALGDLGQLFADTDEANRGRASSEFLVEVVRQVHEAGYAVVNVDVTVMAEAPRLAGHVESMRENLAGWLGAGVDQVSVKATRGEGLGPEGEGRAITAFAVASLVSTEEAST
jgi:2-C-methyl-D-erythritol 2,4-cyclodiphosphate synthase